MNVRCIKSVEHDGQNFIEGLDYEFYVKFDSQAHRPPYVEYSCAGVLFYDPRTAKLENKLCFNDYFIIDDPNVSFRTPLDDMKDCVDKALKSNVNPFERMMDFDKEYGKSRPSIMVGGIVNAEWGTAAGPSEKVTVLTDPFHLGSLKIGNRVKVIIMKEE